MTSSREGINGPHKMHRFTDADSTWENVKNGDVVLVALEVVDGDYCVPEEIRVRVWAKQGPYEISVDRRGIYALLLPAPPDEPPHSTKLLLAAHPDRVTMFIRDDAVAPREGVDGCRWPAHWFDVAAGEWITWPEAVNRGADKASEMIHRSDALILGVSPYSDAHPLLRPTTGVHNPRIDVPNQEAR